MKIKSAHVRVSRHYIIGGAWTGCITNRHIDNCGIETGLCSGIRLKSRIVAIDTRVRRDIDGVYVSESDLGGRTGWS